MLLFGDKIYHREKGTKMDNDYNQQTNVNSDQQGVSYQQGNAYQQGTSYQQGSVYQQGNPYQQGAPYQQDNAYQQGTSYQQGNAYQQGTPYQQGNAYQQGNPYQQGSAYQQGNPYQQGNMYQQGNPYQQNNSYINNNSYGNQGGSYNYGGNSEPQKAPNIFEQFALSFIPTRYERLTRVGTGSMIGFVTLLALVATIISFVRLMIVFSPSEMRALAEELPDFEIRGGQMSLEEDFLYDDDGILVYMTEDIGEFSYEDASELQDEGYQEVMLVGRNRISIMQNGDYQQYDFDDFGSDMEISKDWIIEQLIPIFMFVIVIGYIIFYIGRVCWYFLCAAVYLLFAMLIASIMKKQQPAGALYRTAVYAKVLMFVIMTLFSMVPFVNISVPFLLRVVITVGFMGFAIAKLPERY